MKSIKIVVLLCGLLPCLMDAAALKKTGLVTRTSSEEEDVQRINSSSLALLREPNRDGFAPLHRAAYHCKPKAIDALVQLGVDVRDYTSCGRLHSGASALRLAIKTHAETVLKYVFKIRVRFVEPTFPDTVSALVGHGSDLNEEIWPPIERDEWKFCGRLTMRQYLQLVCHEKYNLKQCLIAGLQKRKQTHAAVAKALQETMSKDLLPIICNYVVLFEKEDEAVLAEAPH